MSDHDLPNGNLTVRQSEEQENQSKVTDLEEDMKLTKDRWVVKLHPDCGLVYFTDTANDLSSWTNPFSPSIDHEIFEKITLDSEHKLPHTEEAEKLAGYDDVPNRDVFLSDCVLSSKARMTNWIQREHLRVLDDSVARLNYPEYLCVTPLDIGDNPFVHITVRFPKGASDESSTSSTLKHFLSDSVSKLMEHIFKKYFQQYARPLDGAGADGYVLKVVGVQEYLLHMDFPLGYYECAINAARDKVCLLLTLSPPFTSLTPPSPPALPSQSSAKTGARGDATDPRRADGHWAHHEPRSRLLSQLRPADPPPRW
jgi:hypothetical protein